MGEVGQLGAWGVGILKYLFEANLLHAFHHTRTHSLSYVANTCCDVRLRSLAQVFLDLGNWNFNDSDRIVSASCEVDGCLGGLVFLVVINCL